MTIKSGFLCSFFSKSFFFFFCQIFLFTCPLLLSTKNEIESLLPICLLISLSSYIYIYIYIHTHTKPSLNKRRKIFSSCPHRKKHLLQNYHWSGNENKQQHKVGTASANEHTSVIPEESGGQATPLSSA